MMLLTLNECADALKNESLAIEQPLRLQHLTNMNQSEEPVQLGEEIVATQLVCAAADLLEAALNCQGLFDTPAERSRRKEDSAYAETMLQLRAAIAKALPGYRRMAPAYLQIDWMQ
jgi:hypothetical protein